MVDLTEGSFTERELMLIKVRAVGKEREEMSAWPTSSAAGSSTSPEKSYTIELTGDSGKLDAFLAGHRAAPRSRETVRTGASGIGRGERILRVWAARGAPQQRIFTGRNP